VLYLLDIIYILDRQVKVRWCLRDQTLDGRMYNVQPKLVFVVSLIGTESKGAFTQWTFPFDFAPSFTCASVSKICQYEYLSIFLPISDEPINRAWRRICQNCAL